MIQPAYVSMMARYNAWQNRSLIAAADTLDEGQRRLDRGAFFKSIHSTFSHVLWADEVWMHRLAGRAKPERPTSGTDHVAEWDAFKTRRTRLDAEMEDFSQAVFPAFLAADLTWYSGAAGKEVSKPKAFLFMHMFNHQTHHRGQIHAMLTAAGAKPDDTDLFLLEERG